MMKHIGMQSVIGVIVIVITCATLVHCRPRPGRWHILAELQDPTLGRFIVEQEHYSWVEGWRVSFSLLELDNKLYGTLLEMETLRWQDVRLNKQDDSVHVWRGNELVGSLNLSNRVFTNYLDSSYDVFVEGFNDVQGKTVSDDWIDKWHK